MSKKRPSFPMVVSNGSVSVKIYRVKNKAYRVTTKRNQLREKVRFSYYVSYFAGGKRFQKMFASLEKARLEAESKAAMLARGQMDALQIRAEDARTYVNCAEMAKKTGLPLEIIVKEYVEAWTALGGDATVLEAAREFVRRNMHKLPSKTVPEAVEDMIKAREKDGTGDAYLKLLGVHLKQLKKKFSSQLKSVTTAQITEYLQDLPVSARSKNNARATIGAFFKYCKERGWLQRDHEGVSLVPKFKERSTDIEIYSPDEVAELLRVARSELVPFLAIAAFAGLRTAEIERLDWSEIQLKERFIEVKAAKAKTASRRLVPISENLAAWLEKPAKDNERGRVWTFDNTAKQIGWLMEDLNEARALAALEKAATKAGRTDWTTDDFLKSHRARRKPENEIQDEAEAEKADKKAAKRKEQTTFLPDGTPVKYHKAFWKKNALRHSYISYRVAETQDVAQVALEAGNSPQIIFEHYRELVRLKEAKAWFALMPDQMAAGKGEQSEVSQPKLETGVGVEKPTSLVTLPAEAA